MRIGDDPNAEPSLWALQLHILDTISDAVVILDPAMRIQFWNQAATAIPIGIAPQTIAQGVKMLPTNIVETASAAKSGQIDGPALSWR